MNRDEERRQEAAYNNNPQPSLWCQLTWVRVSSLLSIWLSWTSHWSLWCFNFSPSVKLGWCIYYLVLVRITRHSAYKTFDMWQKFNKYWPSLEQMKTWKLNCNSFWDEYNPQEVWWEDQGDLLLEAAVQSLVNLCSTQGKEVSSEKLCIEASLTDWPALCDSTMYLEHRPMEKSTAIVLVLVWQEIQQIYSYLDEGKETFILKGSILLLFLSFRETNRKKTDS